MTAYEKIDQALCRVAAEIGAAMNTALEKSGFDTLLDNEEEAGAMDEQEQRRADDARAAEIRERWGAMEHIPDPTEDDATYLIDEAYENCSWLLAQREALIAEHDRLAARCAALESILRRRMINPCEVCTGREARASARCARCGRELKFANWGFDEAKFVEGGQHGG